MLLLTRLQGGAIKAYALADGRRIDRDSLSELLELRREYAAEAEVDASGSSFAIFQWSDDPGVPA